MGIDGRGVLARIRVLRMSPTCPIYMTDVKHRTQFQLEKEKIIRKSPLTRPKPLSCVYR